MVAFLSRPRSWIIEDTLLTYRVRRKGSVLLTLAAVSPFMALKSLLVDRVLDRGSPRLERAWSYPAENAGP
jgi:hypothetical protein